MLYTAFVLAGAIAAIVLLSARFKFNVFFVLLFVATVMGFAAGLDAEKIISSLKAGLGATIEKIGLLIILGITLGILLEKSGAASSLANAVLRRTNHTPLAMSIIGYVVGLPIFCDSGFVVLAGLARSLSARSKGQNLWIMLALASGLYAVHCLVPPHPGILAAAGTLQVDIGLAMLLGAVVAIPVAVVGYYLGKWYNQRYQIAFQAAPPEVANDQQLPSPLRSLMPVIMPVFLIGLKSVLGLYPTVMASSWWSAVQVLGNPVVALLVGILLCLPLFRGLKRVDFNTMLESALSKSGGILLIIAAGGAFGEVIKALHIGDVFGAALAASGLGLLVPFLLTSVLKIAQGSSTVAIISSASILAPLLPSLGFDTDMGRTLALLAMGAGSISISHTNDAYFWVVTKFGEVEDTIALKTYTLMTAAMGVTGLIAVWMLWFLIGLL